jgi:chemotaxis protein MotA
MAKGARKKRPANYDFATIAGLVVALGGMVGGLILEGGSIKDVAQVTAAIIVFGGTVGAVMVNTPMPVLRGSMSRLVSVFKHEVVSPGDICEEIIGYATKARKNGIVSLEQDASEIEDPFLKKALNLAVDGADLQELRKMMELEIGVEEQKAEREAKVFESAGGYAPTVGIIGAVMGLIQVMKHLANIEEVGRGIAVAFVATVYGVGLANIFFLPVANKIKARAHEQTELRELILEGVVGIVEGLNPKLIRTKLEVYSRHEESKPKPKRRASDLEPSKERAA